MTASLAIDELNGAYAIPGVRFAMGKGSLPFIAVKTAGGEANIYLHGAHVTHYQPAGQSPVLFLSERSYFRADKPIRGGIPLIFPWFGARQHDVHAPMHGFARTQTWAVDSVTQEGVNGDVTVALKLDNEISQDEYWPLEFELLYRVTVGASLGLSLQVSSSTSFEFEAAMHTYFRVSDVRHVSVAGLESLPYLDKTDGMQRKMEQGAAVKLTGHTDRIYLGATGRTQVLTDAGLKRRVRLESFNAAAAVVWNPWDAKVKSIADLAPAEWQHMLCVETANVADHAVTLMPGVPHEMRARITAETVA